MRNFTLKPTGNPWQDFLSARVIAIHAFREEGKTFEEIADILNLGDGDHAARIYARTDSMPIEFLPGLEEK